MIRCIKQLPDEKRVAQSLASVREIKIKAQIYQSDSIPQRLEQNHLPHKNFLTLNRISNLLFRIKRLLFPF